MSKEPKSRPTGAPSALQGLHYQIVWAALQAVRLAIRDDRLETAVPNPSRVLLEPREGGGDVQEFTGDTRRVVQLKLRSGNRTWSLNEVIEEVFSDLVHATSDDRLGDRYEFVTEGRIGDWHDVLRFFESLAHRSYRSDPLEALYDDRQLSFRARDSALAASRTERSLFECIVAKLASPAERGANSEHLRRCVFALLRGFRVRESITAAWLDAEIDGLLTGIVEHREDVPSAKRRLLQGVAELSSRGGCEFVVGDFLAAHDLRGHHLAEVRLLVSRARTELQRALELRRYSANDDVRRHEAATLFAAPYTTVTGESGNGKTWTLYAMADLSLDPRVIPVLVDLPQSAEAALQSAADIVWKRLAGHDRSLDLANVTRRVRESTGADGPSIRLFIDGLSDPAEARKLARCDLAGEGITLALSGPPPVVDAFFRETHTTRVTVRDFTHEQLSRYLAARKRGVPSDMSCELRELLRRPLLASLYREIADEGQDRPVHEFAILHRFWERICAEDGSETPLARVGLARLALKTVFGMRYPWSAAMIADAGLDNASIVRLIATGWLRRLEHDDYAVPHDRLLCFAGAQGYLAEFRTGQRPLSSVAALVHDTDSISVRGDDRPFKDLPGDLLSLAVAAGEEVLAVELLTAIGTVRHHFASGILTSLLPQLGDIIVPVTITALRGNVGRNVFLERAIVQALVTLRTSAVSNAARDLLYSNEPSLQRIAALVLRACPRGDLLDKLWEIHQAGQRAPDPFGVKHKGLLYEATFDALEAAVRLEPAWLVNRIESSETAEPVHDLAYLLASLDNAKPLWLAHKKTLRAKVRPEKARALVQNIISHGDETEIAYLEEQARCESEFVGASALRALARVAPDRAVVQLPRVPVFQSVVCRGWFMPFLLARAPEGLHEGLLESVKIQLGGFTVLSGYECDADAPLRDLLVDRLGEEVLAALAGPPPFERAGLTNVLDLLKGACSIEWLARFRKLGGTEIERALTCWLKRVGSRPRMGLDRTDREPALAVLLRCGGDGFLEVVNDWLKEGSDYGKYDALRAALRRADCRTLRLAQQIAIDPALRWVEQNEALRVLVEHHAVDAVIEVVMTRGLDIPPDLRFREALSSAELYRALEVLDSAETGAPRVGAVYCLGFGAGEAIAKQVVHELRHAQPDSELALSCVHALRRLKGAAREGVPILTDHLGKVFTPQVREALFAIGGQAAYRALYVDLQRAYDVSVAVRLANIGYERDSVAAIIARESEGAIHLTEALRPLAWLKRQCIARVLDRSAALRDQLYQVAYDVEESSTGSRRLAIKALAAIDLQGALRAAIEALQSPATRNRHVYPSLIMRLEPEVGLVVLTEALTADVGTAVLRAIGDAVGPSGGTWRRLLKNDVARVRRYACEALPSEGTDFETQRLLQELVDDRDEDVSFAAADALVRLRRGRRVGELVHAFASSVGTSDRWIMLDAITELGDSGPEGLRPKWVRTLEKQLSSSMQHHLSVWLDKSQKEWMQRAHRAR